MCSWQSLTTPQLQHCESLPNWAVSVSWLSERHQNVPYSCPYPSQSPLQETQTDKQAGSSRRILNLDYKNHTLPAPDTANTSQVWSRHHRTLTSLWVLGIQTSPHHELFGSAFSLLWSTMTLSQSYCNCRHASKSHLQSLARDKKKQHALTPEWIRSNTHYRSQ